MAKCSCPTKLVIHPTPADGPARLGDVTRAPHAGTPRGLRSASSAGRRVAITPSRRLSDAIDLADRGDGW